MLLRASLCSLFFLLLSGFSAGPGQQPVSKEYQIKAVFLFNFTQFVQWPSAAFAAADSPLVIGVVGDNPFGPFLEETVKGEMIEKHNLVVERYTSVEDIKDCHILFVSFDDKQDVRAALARVAGRPVLTVSDGDNFERIGGMIRFFPESGRIRLRINVEPVDNAGLIVSSKLLRLAEIVPARNN